MSRKWAARGLIAAAVLGAFTLSACSGPAGGTTPTTQQSTATPVAGGTMTVGLDREVPSLDPAAGAIGQQPLFILANALYEPLMKPGKGGTVIPGLATSVEADPTGTTWTIELPAGLTFSDGSPLTATSIKQYFEHLVDPETKSASAGQLAQVKDMAVESDTVLTLTLHQPNADFSAQFARGLGMIASTTATDEFGFPLGAGPYKVEKFVGGDSITVTRNDEYKGSEPAYLDSIVYSMMPDSESRLQSLQAGDVDLMWSEVASHFEQARSNDALAVHAAPAAMTSIVLNLANPKFADLEVRHALAQAIDRDAVNTVVNLGEGTTVDNPYALLGELAPEIMYPKYDPAAAKQVLEGRDLAFELTVNNRTETVQRGTVLKDMLAEVGVTVTLKPLEAAEYGATLGAQDFEAADFVTSLFADAAGGRLVARSEAPVNFGAYSNPAADAALDAAAANTNVAERAADLKAVSQNLADNLPLLWLTASNAGFVSKAEVAGMPDLTGISLVSVQPASIGWAEAQQ